MGLEKDWFMQEFPFRLIPTLPALLRGLQWVCSEDVCSALCSAPPGYLSLGRELQPAHPFPKRPLRSSGEDQDLTHTNPHGAPHNSREQRKTEEIFPLLPYALLLFFFLTFAV